MVDTLIKDTLECDYIQSLPLIRLTKEQLVELAEKARENNLILTLKAEHSNLYQGVLVSLVKRGVATELIHYL